MISELSPGKLVEIATGVRRLVAPNPGMMTGPGTNTYLVGNDQVAVIDPGPNIGKHIDAIQELSPGKIHWILCTHTHPDHSPGATPLAQATGAELMGIPAPKGKVQDKTFEPDRILADNDLLETEEFAMRAIHTPGHASNHLCFRHEAHRWLFTGDHIMSGSTVVIDPPDGNMQQYLDALARLKELDLAALAPGHGPVIDNPNEMVDWLIDHRLKRETKVISALEANPGSTLWDLTLHVYDEVDPKLHRLASRSLLAHLLKLEADGHAVCADERWTLALSSRE
ncbi:MAG: MBL fold metallo-hydrolase [Gammaproteobacteria bacterium]|nr:MBL fold metallo-hydrolase [Gammaproteobacteria bacterium]